MTATPDRVRPRLHFTAADGWINDPYGITWDGQRYHLFFQAIPGTVVWGPNCHWGHATSPDLVHWTEQPLALVPQAFEVGCWSGSVVAAKRLLFYTRVTGEDWGQGAIAAAHGDPTLTTWTTSVEDVLVPGPPAEAFAFRDPYVFRYGDRWLMIVGAGLRSGSGAALQYSSDDLQEWRYDGVLAQGSGECWTGAIWECPQLFRVDEHWVLLVSVWDDGELYHVAAAVGRYDGRRFTAERWHRLTDGDSAYAMTAFADREGRPCVMSWLREVPRNDPSLLGWAGAHSVAALLELDDEQRAVLRPHPDVLANVPAVTANDGDDIGGVGPLLIRAPAGAGLTVAGVPVPGDLSGATAVLLDADVVEIFGPRRYGAYRAARVC